MSQTHVLSPLQARIIGVLIEKEQTVPDTYPLTLNALTTGCNQKNNRDPVMAASESDVLQALDGLRQASWVIESSGGRTMRYSQNMRRVLDIPSQAVALLATLMLRGAQTAAELRANADRLHRFADQSSVEGFLRELAERPAGALVQLLTRQPGAREARWAHLLCGPIDIGAAPRATDDQRSAGPSQGAAAAGEDAMARLSARIDALERRVGELDDLLRTSGIGS